MKKLPFEYGFRNLARSRVRLITSLIGATLVVLLALAAGGFVQGMNQTLSDQAPLHENVIILGSGSEESIERSQIDVAVEGVIASSIPGLRSEAGQLFVSPEIHIALPVRRSRDDPREHQAVMRGVRPVALLVHPQIELIEGRLPNPGHDELMVGQLAATRLGLPDADLAVGRTLYFDNRDWTIVGRFAALRTVMNAEIWLPLIDLQIATKREASLSCVVASLDTATFDDLDTLAKSRLDLEIVAMRQADYYRSIADFYRPIRVMIVLTASLIAVGGLLGGLTTMYAAFASRVREVGTLQAIGFTRPAVVLSLLEESTFTAACGAIIALIVGLLTLDGRSIPISMGAFTLSLEPGVILAGLLAGLAVGAIGAVPPAIRCLKLPIPEALRAV